MKKALLSTLRFLLLHLREIISLSRWRENESKKTLPMLEKLIAECQLSPELVGMQEVLVETQAYVMFEDLEGKRHSPAEIVSNFPGYEKALEALRYTLAWQRKGKSVRLPKHCYRAALCYCRLGNFTAADEVLREGIEAARVESDKSALMRLRAACSRLRELTPDDRNLWEYFIELSQRDPTPEEEEHLELIERSMKEIKIAVPKS